MYGLYFSEDADSGKDRTVTTETRINMLDNVMSVNNNPDILYQQDGATSHTTSVAMEWLRNRFRKKIISHRPDFPWSALSPDL